MGLGIRFELDVFNKLAELEQAEAATNTHIQDAIFGMDSKTPLELFEARNAVRIAHNAAADKYAASIISKAGQQCLHAEDVYRQKQNKAAIDAAAKEATETAEEARVMAVKQKAEEEAQARLAMEKKAAEDREAKARSDAEAEARRRQEAEKARIQAEQAKAEAERMKLEAQQAAQEPDRSEDGAAVYSVDDLKDVSGWFTTTEWWRNSTFGWRSPPGCFAFFGGIFPASSLSMIVSHRLLSRAASDIELYDSRSRSPSDLSLSLPWQVTQYCWRNGRTVALNFASRAAEFPSAARNEAGSDPRAAKMRMAVRRPRMQLFLP